MNRRCQANYNENGSKAIGVIARGNRNGGMGALTPW